MNFRKLIYIYEFGGIRLLQSKIQDKIIGSKKAKEYQYELFSNADVSEYPILLKKWYKASTGEDLNLDDPQTFNEKIQWLKLYDSTPLKTRLADKYLVRDWVKEKIGEEYLVPLLGVWDKFDDIDFDSLPNQFALKCNHGSNMNVIVKDKSLMDMNNTKEKFDSWMKINYAFTSGLELQYKDIHPKIMSEKYIEQLDNDLLDYKIHVFNGIPKIIQIIGNRNFETHTAKECFLTTDWIPRELMYHTYDSYKNIPEKPENLNELLEIAGILGKGFSYVRVDLYDISGKIIFGEMTFTPASGIGKWKDKEASKIVGSWINY